MRVLPQDPDDWKWGLWFAGVPFSIAVIIFSVALYFMDRILPI